MGGRIVSDEDTERAARSIVDYWQVLLALWPEEVQSGTEINDGKPKPQTPPMLILGYCSPSGKAYRSNDDRDLAVNYLQNVAETLGYGGSNDCMLPAIPSKISGAKRCLSQEMVEFRGHNALQAVDELLGSHVDGRGCWQNDSDQATASEKRR